MFHLWCCIGPVLAGLWLCFGLCPGVLQAQNVAVEAVLEIDRSFPKYTKFAYCPLDGGLVLLSTESRSSSRNLSLVKFDSRFKREWAKVVLQNDPLLVVNELSILGERVHLVVTRRETRTRDELTQLYVYDLDGNALLNGRVLLRSPFAERDHVVGVRHSLNNRQMLVYRTGGSGREPLALRWARVSAEPGPPAEAIRQGVVQLGYIAEFADVTSARVGNDGSLHCLVRAKSPSLRTQPSAYWLHSWDAQNQTPAKQRLELQGRQLTDLALNLDRDDRPLVGGLYSEKREGLFIGLLLGRRTNPTDTVLSLTTQRLPDSILTRYMSAARLERGNELNDFYLDRVVLRTDGGMLLVAEMFYTVEVVSTSVTGGISTQTQFSFGDILVFSLAPDGSIEWVQVLEKDQTAAEPTQLSYALFVSDAHLLFFYALRNAGLLGQNRLASNVYLQSIEMEGVLSTPKAFFADHTLGDVFYRGACRQVSPTEGLLVRYVANTRQFTIYKLRFGS